ncbi:fungal pheromone STE3G-protein-coupled receptor [Peniophora sp. CONT]|nr:fungal pheromone STE3G-protein-coupled receptor [Peniophora sp. CONT]
MGATDITYPLYPIASSLAAASLLLVLLTSFVRQSWNLGVAFLCFWLFVENLTGTVNSIAWSDNADIKLAVYCDIVSHLQIITAIVKPMATLIIARRLALIASHRSVELPSKRARRLDLIIDWTLGLAIPLLVTGLSVLIQDARFTVLEGFGCSNSLAPSGVWILLVQTWSIVPPLISITFYYRKVVLLFHRQRRDINRFLHSNGSVSRHSYFRILALASIDILLTLPIGIVILVLVVQAGTTPGGGLTFYPGSVGLHSNWSPTGFLYSDLLEEGTFAIAELYLSTWTSPFLAFVIFGLFGLTAEARASYWQIVNAAGAKFGWTPRTHRYNRSTLGTIEFGPGAQDATLCLSSESQYVLAG